MTFIITQNDKDVLDHICEVLNMGTVRFDAAAGTYRFLVEDTHFIAYLVALFNGNLVLQNSIKGLGS